MMSFNNDLWASLIDFRSLETYPALPCPYCRQKKLNVDKESLTYRDLSWFSNNLVVQRSLQAKQGKISSVLEENQLLGILVGIGTAVSLFRQTPAKFVGFFSCDECGGDVAVTGTALLPATGAPATTMSMLKAEYFSPPVPLFDLSPAIPKPVANEVLQAFQHFHCDLTASGGKLRRAMEKMCEALGYGKKTLHESIEAMSREYPKEAIWLRTLKLVGNEATHSDGIAEDDLLASFRVLEAVLDIFRRKEVEDDVARTLPAIEGKFKALAPPK